MFKKLLMFLFIVRLMAMDNNPKASITVTNNLCVPVILDGKAVFGNVRHTVPSRQTKNIAINEHAQQGFVVWVQPHSYHTKLFLLYQELAKDGIYTIDDQREQGFARPVLRPELPGNFGSSIDFSQSGYPDLERAEGSESQEKVHFNPYDKKRTELHDATLNCNLKQAQYLIFEGEELNAQDACEVTPLHNAAATGYMNMVNLFLDHKESLRIDAQDNHGATPLLVALALAHQKVAIALMKAGADVDLADDNGLTPLHVAVANDLLAAVHHLLQREADPFAKTTKLSFKAQDGVLPIQCTQNRVMHSLLYDAMKEKIDLNRASKPGHV